MVRAYRSILGLAAAAGLLMASGGALAANTGMSGGGGSPGQSMNTFDPAAEYRKGVDAYKAGEQTLHLMVSLGPASRL